MVPSPPGTSSLAQHQVNGRPMVDLVQSHLYYYYYLCSRVLDLGAITFSWVQLTPSQGCTHPIHCLPFGSVLTIWCHNSPSVSLTATTSTSSYCIWLHLGWTAHMHLEYSHPVWIALWLVVMGWHWVSSATIQTTGGQPDSHCAIKFFCEFLPLSKMTSPLSPYCVMID